MVSKGEYGITSPSVITITRENGDDIEADQIATLDDHVVKEAKRNPSVGHERGESEQRKGKEIKNSIPFYRMFLFADSTDVVLMIVGTVAAVANGFSMPLMTVLFGKLIDSFGKTTDKSSVVHEVSKVILELVYLGVGTGIASFLQLACWMVTGERQATRIRNLYLKNILRQDIAFFDTATNAGEVVGRMSGDTIVIQDAMGEKAGQFIQLVSSFLGSFSVAFVQGWLLTLVMLSTIPPIVLSATAMSIVIAKMASRGQTAYAEAAAVVEQTISSIRTVASFTGEKKAVKKYNKSLKVAYMASVQEGMGAGLGLGASLGIIFFGYALGVWFGAKLILNNGYTGGRIINVIFAILIGSFTLGQASPCLSAFAAGQAVASKMFETINRKPDIDAYDNTGKMLDNIKGGIELRDVYFSYPARPNEQIFNMFSLLVPSGTTMALVGESGSGKSTVINLIERFYDPQGGEVLIDGINIKEFQLRWLRGKIGLVSQEPVLFSCSIRDNIAYGKEDATVEEIRAATELANATKFIDKMPKGLDTMVGEHGAKLSGGQKQRVAIARAILKDPQILLLDEATSALDVKSERTVQEALDRIMTNRTTVIVAHRLSTVRNSDTIAIIHRGSIIEKGSHLELLHNLNGAYCKLISSQEMGQDSDQQDLPEQDNILFDASRVSDLLCSFQRSISGGSSHENNSHHSFSVLSKLHDGFHIQKDKLQESKNEGPSEQPPQVPLYRLAQLNKPDLPVILVCAIAASVNGLLFPLGLTGHQKKAWGLHFRIN